MERDAFTVAASTIHRQVTVGELAIGRQMIDTLRLPEYDFGRFSAVEQRHELQAR
jgi:hypothetical protein